MISSRPVTTNSLPEPMRTTGQEARASRKTRYGSSRYRSDCGSNSSSTAVTGQADCWSDITPPLPRTTALEHPICRCAQLAKAAVACLRAGDGEVRAGLTAGGSDSSRSLVRLLVRPRRAGRGAGESDQLAAGPHVRLGKQVGYVKLHRFLADVQRGCDFTVGHSLAHEFE